MTIRIAGRLVELGNPLYHTGIKAWGTVVRFDTGSAVLRVQQGEQQREFYVQANGYINNVRQVYWHEPIVLDLPVQDIGKFQRLVNALVSEFQ